MAMLSFIRRNSSAVILAAAYMLTNLAHKFTLFILGAYRLIAASRRAKIVASIAAFSLLLIAAGAALVRSAGKNQR